MHDEYLIELVRKHPVLYDTTHTHYLDIGTKADIWKMIGEELDADPLTCKSRWNNIRDNYRKSLKKQNVRRPKQYRYSEQIAFLAKYFKGRDDIEDDNREDESDQGDRDDGHYVRMETIKVEDNPLNIEQPLSPSLVNSDPPIKRQRTCSKIIETSSESQDYLMNTTHDNSIRVRAGSIYSSAVHPVDAFLAGIAPTLKMMTPYYLSLAKSEIFATVQKYELQTIVQCQPQDLPRDWQASRQPSCSDGEGHSKR